MLPSTGSTVNNSTSMALGAGPLYVNAVMGQAPLNARRDNARKTSLQITARHDIEIEESTQPSRPDSWSMHYDRTDQAPYSSCIRDNMMTQTSLLKLPKENPSRELAFFLRTTGPTAPHRLPSKIGRQPRASRNALRILGLGHKRSTTPFFPPKEESVDALPLQQIHSDHGRLNGVLRDEGGLLSDRKEQKKTQQAEKPAPSFLQEVSLAGQCGLS